MRSLVDDAPNGVIPTPMQAAQAEAPGPARRAVLAPPQEEGVEVELDGQLFVARAMTRSAQRRLEEAEKDLEAAEDTEAAALAIIAVVDAMVEPKGAESIAGDLLRKMWEGDRLSISQLSRLLEDIAEAAQARPT